MRASERISDIGAKEYSAEDLKNAREELIEKLLAGESVGFPKIDLEWLLDAELENNYLAFLRSLYEHFAGIASCDNPAQKCLDGEELMRPLVERYLNTHRAMVEEHASHIAAMKLEDE